MQSRIAELKTSADLRLLGNFAERFVELPVDAEWLSALAGLAQARRGFFRTYAQRFARLYLSDFDANALTGMYRMLLLPSGAWQRLLGGRPGGRLLDVGAGSGDVTAMLAEAFDEIETTEVSRGMARRLARRGFRCHNLDLADQALEAPPFHAVSLLNVLDRCQRPRSLLERSIGLLQQGGRLIVALALPYRPFYFAGPTTPDPLERLECSPPGAAGSWEDQARRFLERDLLPLGLSLECFARAPYLSAGDSARALYELDDVVAVLSKR
jgi:protein-L-isoaspartate O-methyltransferase